MLYIKFNNEKSRVGIMHKEYPVVQRPAPYREISCERCVHTCETLMLHLLLLVHNNIAEGPVCKCYTKKVD